MSNNNHIDEKAIAQQLGAMIGRFEGSQAIGYQLLARQQNRRLARYRAVEARLSANLNRDDPRLVAAQQATQRTGELALALQQRVTRLKIQPKLRKDDWVVAGSVSFKDGTPAANLTVRVFDKDRKLDDFLGAAKTNKSGDFVRIYDVCDFKEKFGDSMPELFFQVEDRRGKQLAATTKPLRIEAGRVDQIDVQLTLRKNSTRLQRKKQRK